MPQLEIYSDFICIWCYFNKPSIKKIKHNYDVNIRYRAFPLHPDIPDGGMPIEELFGYNFPVMNDKMQKLEEVAASLRLPLAKRSSISNSRLSQELAKWAETKGKLEEFQDAIYAAYFSEGQDIGDKAVLSGIAEFCGLSKAEALEVIETRVFRSSVDMDWHKSEESGIMAAPTYIMNDTKLPGSQSYEKLEALMIKNKIQRK